MHVTENTMLIEDAIAVIFRALSILVADGFGIVLTAVQTAKKFVMLTSA